MEFELTHEFNTTPQKLYTAYLDSLQHEAMTGGEADITNVVGDDFSAWDEYITGRNIFLEPNSKILPHWRTTDFPETRPDSIVEISLEELEPNRTKLTLKHSNLTDKNSHYKKGWIEHYFKPITEFFVD